MHRRAFVHSDVTECVTKWVPDVARKVRYLLERDGRYYARLVVPAHLRSYLEGKTELRVPLGADYREATKAIHGAVADLQFKIKQAEVRAADAGVAPRSAAPFEISAEQMALRLFRIRMTELTQLRKQDVRTENGRRFIRITPDAGSVKTRIYRDVPLHSQVVHLGFGAFVDSAQEGPLFFENSSTKNALSGARTVSGRLSEWLGSLKVVPEGVQPNHGWRHRFKTLGRELGYSDRVVDAICGHAGRTAGDGYGDVTLDAKLRVIDALKPYAITAHFGSRLDAS